MKGLENQAYLIGYIVSNILAIMLLVSSWKWPRTARVLFLILFAWACRTNWETLLHSPQVYLEYADLTFLPFYKHFILGWFAGHIQLAIGLVATCQGLIAIALLLKGWMYKLGLTGGITFLIAIAPFGVGSGFPCTLITAVAMALLLRQNSFLWQYARQEYVVTAD